MAGNMNDLQAFHFDLDGSAATYDFVCTRGWSVRDVNASSNATIGGATAILQRATAAAPSTFNNVTSVALSLATVDQITYAEKILLSQAIFSAGDVMRVSTVNAAEGNLFVEVLPTTWIAG